MKGTSKKHQIYYDRVNQKEEDELNRSKWYRFLICRGCNRLRGKLDDYLSQVAPQGPADNGANGDIDITYKDLQTLINEFRDQMEVLKSKLSSQAPEVLDKADLDGDGIIDEEEALIQELNDLREFVTNNKECIEDFFHIKRDGGSHPHA